MRAWGAERAVVAVAVVLAAAAAAVAGVKRHGQSLSFCGPETSTTSLCYCLFFGNAFLKIDSFILFWGAHPFLNPPIMGGSPFSSLENVGGSPLP